MGHKCAKQATKPVGNLAMIGPPETAAGILEMRHKCAKCAMKGPHRAHKGLKGVTPIHQRPDQNDIPEQCGKRDIYETYGT